MTLPLVPKHLESAMAKDFENDWDRAAETHVEVERWEEEGGARETERPTQRTPDVIPASERTIPQVSPGGVAHDRDKTTGRHGMNGTTRRRMQVRDLAQRVEHARSAVVQQTIERETAIRRDGAAHPRSIRASRRLNRTRSAYHDLLMAHRRRSQEDTHHG